MSENELAAVVAQMRKWAGKSCSADASAIRLWADRLEAAARPAWETELIAAGERYRDHEVNTATDELVQRRLIRELVDTAKRIPQEDGK
jgi:hypothetical protein